MKWLEALKAWNAKKGGRYTIPKKGSKEYNEVRAMMGKELKGGMPKRRKERRPASDYKEGESEPEMTSSESDSDLSVYESRGSRARSRQELEDDERREILLHNIEAMEAQIDHFNIRIQNLQTMEETPQRIAQIENYLRRIQALQRNIREARAELQEVAETESESEGSGLTGGVLERPEGIEHSAEINNQYNLALKKEIEELEEELLDFRDIIEVGRSEIKKQRQLREHTVEQYHAVRDPTMKARLAEAIETIEYRINEIHNRFNKIVSDMCARFGVEDYNELPRLLARYKVELEEHPYIM